VWDGNAQQRCFEEQRQPPRRCAVCRDHRRQSRELMREPVSDLGRS
jgi:hypothetical protein